jgi:hypothetical protein
LTTCEHGGKNLSREVSIYIATFTLRVPEYRNRDIVTTLNPDIKPYTRKTAVLWLLAQIVIFRQEEYHISTLRDYITYVKKRKDELYMHPNRRTLVANYLFVVDKP